MIVLHALVPAPAEIGRGSGPPRSSRSAPGSLVGAGLVLAVIALAEGALPSPRGAADVRRRPRRRAHQHEHRPRRRDADRAGLARGLADPAARPRCSSSPTGPTSPSTPSTARSSSSTASRARSAARRTSRPRSSTCSSARASRSACGSAEIILFGVGGDVPLRTSLDASGADADDAARPPRARRGAARLCCATSTPVVDRASARRRSPRYLDEHGIAEAAIAPVPGETRLVGVMLLGDRLGARPFFTGVRPAPVRDARRPRRHVARVRPAGAGDPAHARAAGRARAPGLPRPAHRPRQPRAVHAPRARVAGARPARARCSSSTSTTSSASTTTPATPPATPC